jgi:hypothetical protein
MKQGAQLFGSRIIMVKIRIEFNTDILDKNEGL